MLMSDLLESENENISESPSQAKKRTLTDKEDILARNSDLHTDQMELSEDDDLEEQPQHSPKNRKSNKSEYKGKNVYIINNIQHQSPNRGPATILSNNHITSNAGNETSITVTHPPLEGNSGHQSRDDQKVTLYVNACEKEKENNLPSTQQNGTLTIEMKGASDTENLLEDRATLFNLLDNSAFQGKYSGQSRFLYKRKQLVLNIDNINDIPNLLEIKFLTETWEGREKIWPIECSISGDHGPNHVVGVLKHIPPSVPNSRIWADIQRNETKNADIGVKVLEIKRIQKKGETSNIHDDPTWCVFIKFQGKLRPSHMYYGRDLTIIKPYISPTILCSKCRKTGHKPENCTSRSPRCAKCSKNHHTSKCTLSHNDPNRKCPNCKGNHNAGYGGCIYIQTEKKVKILQATQNVSRYDARRHCWTENNKQQNMNNQNNPNQTQNDAPNAPDREVSHEPRPGPSRENTEMPQNSNNTNSYSKALTAGEARSNQALLQQIQEVATGEKQINPNDSINKGKSLPNKNIVKTSNPQTKPPNQSKGKTEIKNAAKKESEKTVHKITEGQKTKQTVTICTNDMVKMFLHVITIATLDIDRTSKLKMALQVIGNLPGVNLQEILTEILPAMINAKETENIENINMETGRPAWETGNATLSSQNNTNIPL